MLVIRWVWDTPDDANEFTFALRGWATAGLGARPAGSDRWVRKSGGGLAITARGDAVALAFDATPDAAAELSQATLAER